MQKSCVDRAISVQAPLGVSRGDTITMAVSEGGGAAARSIFLRDWFGVLWKFSDKTCLEIDYSFVRPTLEPFELKCSSCSQCRCRFV